ncbi:MAG: hypothetical protein IKE70_01825 [Bacilli bacterium]|nr:hypothetical protein [Bacilli bacterium]
MTLNDVFDEILVGYNITNAAVKDKYSKMYKTLQKDSIQYTNMIDSRLIEKAFTGEVKKKYFLHPRDILIFVQKPYRVGTYTFEAKEDIVIPNNFIILRGINMNLYSYIFVANYLEKFGIKNYIEKNQFVGNLTIDDIKKIELPDISKERQMRISPLLNAINERSAIYTNILENDDKIIRYAIESITGDIHD